MPSQVALLTGQDVGVDLGDIADAKYSEAISGVSRLVATMFDSEVHWRRVTERTDLAGMRARFRSHTTNLASEEEYADAREEGDLRIDVNPAHRRDYGVQVPARLPIDVAACKLKSV